MRKRSSLTVKILALVLCPLALQLVFLVWIARLESDADKQLALSIRAEKIAEAINRLSSDIFDFAALCNDENAISIATMSDEFDELQGKIRGNYDRLKELTSDNDELRQTIFVSESAMLRMVRTSEELKRIAKSANESDHKARKLYWRSFRADTKSVLYGGLLEMAKRQKNIAQISSENQMSLRSFSQNVAMGGALITIAFAALIAFYFLRNVTRRLNVVSDNASRLAAGVDLHPQVSGNDDIAFLDSMFHQMAESLKNAHEREQAVVDNAHDFICALDKSGRFISANPASHQILGASPDEVRGRYLADFLVDDPGAAQTIIKDVIKAGKIDNLEISLRRVDGATVRTRWSAQWSEGQSIASCVVQDVTELYAAQQLRQELMSMITHDLRTPLTTLNNVLTLLQRGDHCTMDAEAEKIAAMGTRQVGKMAQLVNDLLDIDKINSGQMRVTLTKILLDECFHACNENLKLLAEDKHIDLEFAPTSLMVLGDEEKIDRTLVNLVANAIKFSPRGGRILVSARLDEGFAHISVKDQGSGIPSDQFQTIFDRFTQTDISHADAGSGLGLAICKAFVGVQGGRIWVESSSKDGTTFTFTLPSAT